MVVPFPCSRKQCLSEWQPGNERRDNVALEHFLALSILSHTNWDGTYTITDTAKPARAASTAANPAATVMAAPNAA